MGVGYFSKEKIDFLRELSGKENTPDNILYKTKTRRCMKCNKPRSTHQFLKDPHLDPSENNKVMKNCYSCRKGPTRKK